MISQPKTAICTVITHNRIAQARALFDSINQHNARFTCYVLVIDAPVETVELRETGCEVIGLHSLQLGRAADLLFQYTPFELCCALKPAALRFLFNELGYQQAIYLDSDILVFSELGGLVEQFESFDILVTPHLDAPYPTDGKKPDDAHVMLSGVFNLGFIGVKNSEQGNAFLRWWMGKLEKGCIQDHFNGVFVDQKYVDMAVGLFSGVGIVRDLGCNVAYWNLHSRQISCEEGKWLVNGVPLVFYHFSDFDPSRPGVLSGHQDRFQLASLLALQAMFQHYCDILEHLGLKQTRNLPYGYARYSNGRRISPAARRAFLLAPHGIRPEQPFDKSSHTIAFKFAVLKQWLWLQFNRLAHVLLKH